MNENRAVRNKKLAEKVIKGLKSRHMEGFFAETKEEALKIRAGGVSEASAESAESGADEPPAETAPKITSRKVRTKPRTTRRAAEADPLD